MKRYAFPVIIFLLIIHSQANAADYLDLPPCHALTAADGKFRLGLTPPLKNPDLAARAYELSLFYSDLSLCQSSWNDLLPQWQPQAPVAELERYYGYAVYAAAFVITLLLFALLPAAWQRHITLLALLAVGIGTYAIASGSLWLSRQMHWPQSWLYQEVVLLQKSGEQAHWLDIKGVWELDRQLSDLGLKTDFSTIKLGDSGIKPEQVSVRDQQTGQVTEQYDSEHLQLESTGNTRLSEAGMLLEFTQLDLRNQTTVHVWTAAQDLPLHTPVNSPEGRRFRVHNSLNIRREPGVHSPQLDHSPLHRGTIVQVIAAPQGDWWKVRVEQNGDQGWVSSLWLRPEEAADD